MPDQLGARSLVLDTSVWINLLATELFEPILLALNVHCYAPTQVVAEITRNPITRATFTIENHPLRAPRRNVSIVELSDSELSLFLDLVGAPAPDALGDGEAATLAVAVAQGLSVVMDDRKGRRVARDRFGLHCYWTADLLRAPELVDALGAQAVEACFTKAIQFARMHVPRG